MPAWIRSQHLECCLFLFEGESWVCLLTKDCWWVNFLLCNVKCNYLKASGGRLQPMSTMEEPAISSRVIAKTFEMLVKRLGDIEDLVQDVYKVNVDSTPRGSTINGNIYGIPCKLLKNFNGKHTENLLILLKFHSDQRWAEILESSDGGLNAARARVQESFNGKVVLDGAGQGALIAHPDIQHTLLDVVNIIKHASALVPFSLRDLQEVEIASVEHRLIHDIIYIGNKEGSLAMRLNTMRSLVHAAREADLHGTDDLFQDWQDTYATYVGDVEYAAINQLFLDELQIQS